jgi:predicted NBD/HSP70 family sugar kinase
MSKNRRNVEDREPLRKSAQTELGILRLIQAAPSISRIELAERSGLSTAAISGIVNALIQRNLLVEEPSPASAIGRRRIGLSLRSDLGYVVGIDLGTFNLRVVVTDLNGTPFASRQEKTEMWLGRTDVLNRCFAMVKETVAMAGIRMDEVRGMGVAFSGVIDVEHGVILSYPRPGQMEQWKNIPLKALFEEEFAVPCLLEDSVRAIATFEKTQGSGREFNDFVYVDVGMGVGSAIFINGQIYRGFNGSAGEFGHMTVDEDGPLCCCGSSGCLEAVASCATIIESVKVALRKGVTSKIIEMAQGDSENITVENIAGAAEDNDSLAYRALHEAAAHIGAACADLVNLLNPQAIVFGGALFRAAPKLVVDEIRRAIRRRALEKPANEVKLVVSPAESDAGAKGIARLIAAGIVEPLFMDGLELTAAAQPAFS